MAIQALRHAARGRNNKVFTLQTLHACDHDDPFTDTVGKVAEFFDL